LPDHAPEATDVDSGWAEQTAEPPGAFQSTARPDQSHVGGLPELLPQVCRLLRSGDDDVRREDTPIQMVQERREAHGRAGEANAILDEQNLPWHGWQHTGGRHVLAHLTGPAEQSDGEAQHLLWMSEGVSPVGQDRLEHSPPLQRIARLA
jgi:hypothetical protein